MIGRRDFLLTPVLAGLSAPVVAAEQGNLPAPIASLPSMRNQARPITAAERSGRLAKARRLMSEQKLDAMVLTGGTSLVYFSNIRWGISERLFAMVVPVKGDPFYVCPAFEEDRAREQISRGPLAASPDVRTGEEDASPYAPQPAPRHPRTARRTPVPLRGLGTISIAGCCAQGGFVPPRGGAQL